MKAKPPSINLRRTRKYTVCIIFLIILLIYICGCKAVKVSRDKKKETGKQVEQEKEVNRTRTEVVEYFDETLKGAVPIRLSDLQDDDSLVFPVESKGISLDFVVKADGVSYRAKVKPVARSSLSSETKEKETTKTETKEVVTEKTKEVKKPAGRLPWWIWIILIVIVIIFILRKLFPIAVAFMRR
jgi:preprotein translocase subunit SecF